MDVSPTMSSSMFADIRLESESEISDMDESISSGQMELTASCQDTPDTESSSDCSEFSVAGSSISGVASLPEISSGPEDDVETFHPVTLSAHRCVKCRMTVSLPFLHCRRCYNDRKRFLPPRPIVKKSQRTKMNSKKSASSKGNSHSNSAEERNFSSLPLEETPSQQTLCGCCMSAPCNGVFIHGVIAHQVFCYSCSHRIWMERKTCPYCNRTISKVVKLFQVDLG